MLAPFHLGVNNRAFTHPNLSILLWLSRSCVSMAGQHQLQLHAVTGPMQGTVAEFPAKKKVSIGRTRANAYPIKHDTVSQRHAFIMCKKGQWFVTDSDSSNGTFLNGILVAPRVPTELKNGDRLGFGPENEVNVKISSVPGEEAENHGAGGNVEGLVLEKLTLRKWFEQVHEWLIRESESLPEISIRELEEYAEAQKKEFCAAVGVECTLVSL